MEQKIKFIVIGLMVILAVSLFMNLQLQTVKKNIELERDQLKSENISLSKKTEEIIKGNHELQNRIDLLNSDMSKLSQEKDQIQRDKEQIQKQLKVISKERDLLVEKLKTQPQVKEEVKEGPPKIDDAYWAGILKAKTDLALQLDNLRSDLKSLRISNEQLERDLETLGREKQELEKQISYNQKMLDNLSAELVIERNTTNQQRENLKSVKSENVILRRQVKSLSSRKADLEQKVFQLQEERNGLEKQFNQMAATLENRLAGISELREQLSDVEEGTAKTEAPQQQAKPQQAKTAVELPAIVVRPQGENKTSNAPSLARVISINKENNFVVIDQGENSGLKLGDKLKAYRNNQEIANLEVMQTRWSIAACDIKLESSPLRVGDIVK